MVGKKSGRALLRDEGLQRTDNSMDFTSWPQVNMINQKNYYTEVLDGVRKGKKDVYALNMQYVKSDFLKRDDQILAIRLQQEERLDQRKKQAIDIDRARAQAAQAGVAFNEPDPDLDEDVAMDDAEGAEFGSKTIVIHVGSQNLRVGLATDALPRTVPMVIARRSSQSEAEACEPRPKRLKLHEDATAEEEFGEEFAKDYSAMAADFRTSRRVNKRRVLPNSRELVTKWNSATEPELISEHNDAMRIDWTEIPPHPAQALDYIVGSAALRIPEKSNPRYRLYWPVQYGWLNERDYPTRTMLERDFFLIIEEAIKNELGLKQKKDWPQYSCVFIIPDIYEKVLVQRVLEELMRSFGFQRVCFMQESLAATFGAGSPGNCIVDIGAQKTSICCIEDGMCLEDSRINMKYGGYDVTETFIRMMLFDRFSYSDFNLMRRHDFLLAEELKEQYTTMSDENITVQLYDFHIRAHGEQTRKYSFKIYDEGMLAPMGYFRPSIFEHSQKLIGRRKLIPRSLDIYSGHPNDPFPQSQMFVANYVQKNIPSAVLAPAQPAASGLPTPLNASINVQSKSRLSGLPSHLNGEGGATPRSSAPGSPAPEAADNETPQPTNGDAIVTNHALPTGDASGEILGAQPDIEAVDSCVPLMPLDEAIATSINIAVGNNEGRRKDLQGAIMLIGGGSKTPHLGAFLEARLNMILPTTAKDKVQVAAVPREIDPAVLVWKGGSVFGKLRMTNDSWIGQTEYDRLGARILNYKCMWHW